VCAAEILAGGDKAFLLAGIGGGLNVWMMTLPRRVVVTFCLRDTMRSVLGCVSHRGVKVLCDAGSIFGSNG